MQTFKAKTVEEAVVEAEKTLHISREMLEIKVTQQPWRGFLGFGRRDAVIEVVKKPQPTPRRRSTPKQKSVQHQRHQEKSAKPVHSPKRPETKPVDPAIEERRRAAANHRRNVAKMEKEAGCCCDYLVSALKELGIQATAKPTAVHAHQLDIEIASDKPAAVIGYHGKRINALEELASAYLDYHGVHDPHLTLDINNYRERRAKTIERLAADCVTEVIASGQAVFLDPMPARERKQLHQLLEKNRKVKTYSHGREPFRSVVVAPAE